MLKINLYSAKGVKKTPVTLPKKFEEKDNKKLLAQAIRVYEDRRHPGLSKVKGRGEVVGSTRKIYKQKGTGGARHGDIRAPIFVGGGTVHGPDGLKRKLTLPKKMKKKALAVAMTNKVKKGRVVALEGLDTFNKTKDVHTLIQAVLKKEDKEKVKRITFAISQENNKANLFIRNIKNVDTCFFKDLNAYKIFNSSVLFVDNKALQEKNPKGKDKK